MTSGEAPRIELPIALIVAAFFLITVFQTEQLVSEHRRLMAIHAEQDEPLQQAGKLRDHFELLASETTKLAQTGNASAKAVLDQLSERGVTIHPTGP
jgi:hypothetical protein